MKVGFIGTQKGMTQAQKDTLRHFLESHSWITEFHQGDCVGADAEALAIVQEVLPHIITVCHPPIVKSRRAFTICYDTREPKDYIARNHDIVDETDTLIAAPKTRHEELRSGTWATVRYARQKHHAVLIFEPNYRLPERVGF